MRKNQCWSPDPLLPDADLHVDHNLSRPSGPQVTFCYITYTDRPSFVSWGKEYPFHFGDSALLIFSYFLHADLHRPALRITILVHIGSIITLLRFQIWPGFFPVVSLCRSEGSPVLSYWDWRLGVFGGPKLPSVLPHTVRPGLHIPLREIGKKGKERR